ncbi:NIPSNAP family protein [Pareuzebyella sediminis]|uniref:NIPSNAP family protein n=1 Tax=Pareuzebyella sediminis TaxID=2607998 RepID=UPI0011EF81B4|nr:NIPSNAP family protein [Pareuzebyella sediminis]
MKRRKFIGAAAAASAIPLTGMAGSTNFNLAQKELYEIRTYEIKFRADQQLLFDYLENALKKSLQKMGVDHLLILQEYGVSDPKRIRVFINYPDAESFMKAQSLNSDSEYVKMAADYNALTIDKALYERFESSLLLAFDGMPQMSAPIDGASLFELRTYEGYSEDAVRRKIKMFNKGEIDIFLKTGLHPVFFGEMIIGPYRPCLTYMLNFKDMEERDANWEKFISHPEWKAMSGLEEYANTVSKIRRIFLKPL